MMYFQSCIRHELHIDVPYWNSVRYTRHRVFFPHPVLDNLTDDAGSIMLPVECEIFVFQAEKIGKNAQNFMRENLLAKDIFCYHVVLFKVIWRMHLTLILTLWLMHSGSRSSRVITFTAIRLRGLG